MKCNFCGREIEYDSIFCGYCGKKDVLRDAYVNIFIKEYDVLSEAVSSVEKSCQYDKSKPSKRKWFIMDFVASIIIVTVFIIYPFSSGFAQKLTFTVNGVSFDMIKVEAGTFLMGATPEMEDPNSNEKPVHQVTLTNNYYIGKTEVTQALWEAVMGSNPSKFKSTQRPVESISWDDCQRFISKLNAVTGKQFRLPTEAEWEFAARGGNKSKHYQYSGSNNINDIAWYSENSIGKTHDVATKQPNELGIYDMSGNVWEWCQDWSDGKYINSSQTNPKGSESISMKVCRSGSCYNNEWECRSSRRFGSYPLFRSYFLGLRLCLSE